VTISSLQVHVNSRHQEHAFLWLMTIKDAESSEIFRIVNNLEDVVSNGVTYTAFPFQVTLPPDEGSTPQSLQVSTFNASADLIKIIRGTLAPPEVKIDLITSNNPDFIHKTIDFMRVGGVEYDSLTLSFELVSSSAFARKTQNHTYNQKEFPGLFYALR
jgi:hypothetical protein